MKMLSIATLAMLAAVAVAQDKPRWVPGFNEEVLKTKKLELYGSPGTITAPGGITAQGNVTGADVISTDDVIAGDDMVVGDDLTVTDRVTCADAVVTDDLIVGDDAWIADDLVVTDLVTCARATVSGVLICDTNYAEGVDIDSQLGWLRIGYTNSYGWEIATAGGGATLVFQTDFARTGGVNRVTMSSAGLAATGISGVLCAAMPVTVTASTTTNVAITVQAKDPAGANLARTQGFRFWFSTQAAQTTASTNDVESFTIANGAVRLYDGTAAAPTYVAETDNAGLFTLNGITVATWATTNRFHLLGANGYYTNAVVVW